jgi:hypothetical protein
LFLLKKQKDVFSAVAVYPPQKRSSLPTFWVVMATADVLRKEDAPAGEEAASAAFPPRSGV